MKSIAQKPIVKTTLLCAGASLLALAAHAQAQTTAPAPGAKKADTDSTVVVVTAFKRSQSTLAVPAAVDAISGNDLKTAGVTKIDDVQNVAPSVNVSRNGFGISTNIRGVTTTDTTSKGEQGVSFSIDGVYYGRPIQQGLAFFDVQRVEVLRGPAGTLYGKASTGGAINVITNKPSLSGFDASATFEYGNYDTRRMQAMVNMPLSDKWAIRAAISTNERDGYLTPTNGTVANGYYTSAAGLPKLNDEDNSTGRFSVLYKPYSDMTFRVTATGGHVGGYGLGEAEGDVIDASNGGKGALDVLPNPMRAGNIDDNFNNLDGEWDFKLGGINVSYLAAYEHFHAHDPIPSEDNPRANDFSGYGQALYQLSDNQWNLHTVEHELRFSNADSGPIDYVIGLNYVRENINENSHVWNSPVATYTDTSTWQNALDFVNKTTHTSAGLFGQATWHATSKIDLVLGLRESEDELTRFGNSAIGNMNYNVVPPSVWLDPQGKVCHYPNACIGTPNNGDYKSSKLTYRAGMNYHLSSTDMLYGSIATGYKAGGFNDYDPRVFGPTPYAPEEMTAYEVGYKGKPMANLTYTTSVFYYDYKGDQISSRLLVNGSTLVFTRLVPATIYGWENEFAYRVSANTNLSLATTMEHSEYKTFMAGALQNVDWKGKSLDSTPDLAFTAGVNHTVDLSGGSQLKLRAFTKYSSGYYLSDFVNAVQFKQKAFTRSDASVTWFPANPHYNVELFVQNIEDKVQKVGAPENYVVGVPNSTTFPISTPRFYGVRLNLQY